MLTATAIILVILAGAGTTVMGWLLGRAKGRIDYIKSTNAQYARWMNERDEALAHLSTAKIVIQDKEREIEKVQHLVDAQREVLRDLRSEVIGLNRTMQFQKVV